MSDKELVSNLSKYLGKPDLDDRDTVRKVIKVIRKMDEAIGIDLDKMMKKYLKFKEKMDEDDISITDCFSKMMKDDPSQGVEGLTDTGYYKTDKGMERRKMYKVDGSKTSFMLIMEAKKGKKRGMLTEGCVRTDKLVHFIRIFKKVTKHLQKRLEKEVYADDDWDDENDDF